MSEKMTKCKSCNADIAANAKVCPNCGAKNKKPMFKKWWFWLIIVIALIAIIGGAGGDDTTASTTNSEESAGIVTEIATEKLDSVTDAVAETESLVAKTVAQTEEKKNDISLGKINALASAESYLRFSAFSYKGLIEQLEFEGYSNDEATYAADNCGADWNEQAAKSAESYLEFSSFSRSGLIDQLEFEGFTHEQAVYGVEAVGY